MSNPMSEAILAFYQGESTDSEGRMIETIWSWNYKKLEYTHNYIQWLFPLKERSRFNRNAPVLNEDVIQTFRTSNELKNRLKKSLEVMLRFYGLECNELQDTDIQITKSHDYPERKLDWIEEDNHNYLRLTRILTSLKLLGLENYAQALLNCLQQIYLEEGENIGTETYAYWTIAIVD